MKPIKQSWELPTRHGYTFVDTNDIRKASRLLTSSKFHRKARVWYSAYNENWDGKDFCTIDKLRKFLRSNPSYRFYVHKSLTDCEHDTTLLILDSVTLKSTGWARN